MTKICRECGEQLEDSASFCKKCGADVSEFMPPAQADEKSYTEYLIVGILGSAFVPLVGMAVGIWLYTRKTPNAKRNGKIVFAAGIIAWILWIIFL